MLEFEGKKLLILGANPEMIRQKNMLGNLLMLTG